MINCLRLSKIQLFTIWQDSSAYLSPFSPLLVHSLQHHIWCHKIYSLDNLLQIVITESWSFGSFGFFFSLKPFTCCFLFFYSSSSSLFSSSSFFLAMVLAFVLVFVSTWSGSLTPFLDNCIPDSGLVYVFCRMLWLDIVLNCRTLNAVITCGQSLQLLRFHSKFQFK